MRHPAPPAAQIGPRVPQLLLACALLVLAAAAGASDAVARATALGARLGPDAPTGAFAQAARELGAVVDEARSGGADDATLIRLRDLAGEFRERTQARLRAAERAAGDDEGALEAFYRSAAWEDLSFAMSAFPYWGAWLDLSLAERPSQAGDRVNLLWRARRGFRAASMQIYQPSLVYGGWLGLGFLAVAEQDTGRARRIFEALERALASQAEHPVRTLAAAELARLDGNAPPAPAPAAVAPTPAALAAEAFALLERHRRTQGGARDAASRLREVIAAGDMDEALLARILGYKNEIVGEDLGPYTALVGAEFAFDNEQWFTAVQKYQAFFAKPPDAPGVRFDRFMYRWAVACFRSDLTADAARIAERLLARRGLEDEVRKAAIKLAYLAQAERATAKSTEESRAALAAAARRFVETSPGDRDADGARVVLAQATGDTQKALALLGQVKTPRGRADGVAATRFYVIAREFARQANRSGAALDALARQGLAAFDELPAEEKKRPENYAFFLQLRAVADRDPQAVLAEIARAEARPEASPASRRAYFWARLRCYDRLQTPGRALDDLRAAGNAPVPGWMAEALYPWIRGLDDPALQAELAQVLAPRLEGLPEMERRFRLLRIENLLASGAGEAAYGEARALLRDYPKAGDGYRMLAQAAAATRRLVEADEAWRVITDKVPPTDEVWWEGMLSRVEIRARSTRPEAACDLLEAIARRPQPAPAAQRARLEDLKRKVTCGVGGA